MTMTIALVIALVALIAVAVTEYRRWDKSSRAKIAVSSTRWMQPGEWLAIDEHKPNEERVKVLKIVSDTEVEVRRVRKWRPR